MTEQPSGPPAAPRFPWLPVIILTVAMVGCSIYANLAFTVTDPANYRFFPPFEL